MPVSGPIADFLTRIRNAQKARHSTIELPASNIKVAIAKILKEQGFVSDYQKIDDGVQGTLKVALKYYNRKPAINELKRVSTPGRRMYVGVENLPKVRRGLGIAIISTSKGVMTEKQARSYNVGGELICTIW
jgi:small subunit ribosomal protein S8